MKRLLTLLLVTMAVFYTKAFALSIFFHIFAVRVSDTPISLKYNRI